jgi:large subunit ribosomal protein L3
MASRNRPRRGSLAYKPLKRARSQKPRIHSWAQSTEAKPLGFAGYKAGMTHVMAVDNRKHSITHGLEIFVPVTVLDSPPMKVIAIRAYGKAYFGKQAFTDVFAKDLKDDTKRRTDLSKKLDTDKALKELEEKFSDIKDIMLMVQTQPSMTSLEKKAADIMEIAVGGKDLKEKFEFAKKVLGKEIAQEEVLGKHKFIDVTAVTKGKGVQGIIKRIGTRIQPRKTEKGRRHGGTGGAWTPARKLWLWPLPGQMGYHTRTEYNKLVLTLGKNGSEVTPAGGFLHYGPITGSYILLYGSVPGPVKRLIRISPARRPKADENLEVTYVDQSSKQGV